MKRPLRIGLINQGGAGWIGGAEYIRNLVLALGRLPAEERAEFEFCLISGRAIDVALAAQLQPHLARIYDLSSALPAPTIPRRLRWRAERDFGGKKNPRFADFVAAEGFDFLYPLTYDNVFNIDVALPLSPMMRTCRWAGWIPDFQHRFLPEFFTEKELAKRDANIATLVGEARRGTTTSVEARTFASADSFGAPVSIELRPTESVASTVKVTRADGPRTARAASVVTSLNCFCIQLSRNGLPTATVSESSWIARPILPSNHSA